MKSTGIVRKIDELGRIVLPMELRKTLNLEQRDPLEIFVEGENIILRKYDPDSQKAEVLRDLNELAKEAKDPITFHALQKAIEYIK